MVVNESHLHTGHAGDDGSGESHYSVRIESDCFENKGRLEAQRTVLKALEEEVSALHALSLCVSSKK